MSDPNSKEMVAATKSLHDLVREDRGADAPASIKQPKTLGVIFRDHNIVTVGMLTAVEVDGEQSPMIVTLSALHLKNRVIEVHIYRRIKKDEDIDTLENFTRKWTAAILAANK